MSTDKGKGKETVPDIEELGRSVKRLIEQCIERNLNKEEVIDVLYEQHGINRSVWQQLVEESQDFFQNYYSKLAMKEQAEMMKQSKGPGTVPSVAESSGSSIIPPINSDHGAPSLLEKMPTREDGQKEEKQRVKDLIKHHVVLKFISKKEVIDILYQTEKIERSFTLAVWEEFEQEDPLFFNDFFPKDVADQHSSTVSPATSNQQSESSSG